MTFYILHLAAIVLCFAYCVYCIARVASKKNMSALEADGDRDGEALEELDESKKARALLYLQRFDERAKGATRTALLWVVALTIVWMTGLEGLQHDVTNRLTEIEENNRTKQNLENEAAEYHLSKSDSYQRIKVIEAHLEEEKGLEGLKKDRDAKRKAALDEDDKMEVEQLDKQIARIEKRKANNPDSTQIQRYLKELQTGMAAKSEEFKAQFDKNASKRGELQEALQTLKQQRRAVSFDILGQKFEVGAVYAPIIWCLFMLGLIFYLARARAGLIVLCVQALATLRSISSTSPNHLKNITADAPWWLAPFPPARVELEQLVDRTEISGKALRTDQLLAAVGWRREYHRLLSLLSISCLLMLVLAQARIAWLGHSISWQIGSIYERSYVPVVFLGISVLTAYAVWLCVRPTHLLGSELKIDVKKSAFSGILLLVAVCGLLLLTALIWNYPKVGEDVGRRIQKSLLTVIACSLIAVATLYWYLWTTLNTGDDLRVDGEKAVDKGRRRLLFGAGGLMGAAALGFFLFRVTKGEGRTDRQRFRKTIQPLTNSTTGLKHGYHLNTKTGIIHYVTAAGSLVGIPRDARIKLERFVPYHALTVQTKSKPGAIMHGVENQSGEQKSDGNYLSVEPAADSKIIAVEERPSITAQTPEVVSAETGGQQLLNLSSDFNPLSESESGSENTRPAEQGSEKKLHVNLAHSSWALEQGVILTLQKKNLKQRDYDRACERLLDAVRHDLYFKSKQRKLPSFRLYDLLAGLSVRFKSDKYLDELVKLVDDKGNSELFSSRKQKWRNTDGDWYKDWSNLKRPKRWAGLNL